MLLNGMRLTFMLLSRHSVLAEGHTERPAQAKPDHGRGQADIVNLASISCSEMRPRQACIMSLSWTPFAECTTIKWEAYTLGGCNFCAAVKRHVCSLGPAAKLPALQLHSQSSYVTAL